MSEGSFNEIAFPKFEYRSIKYSEIMSYYSPTWLAAVGFTASVFAAFQLPIFGFVLS